MVYRHTYLRERYPLDLEFVIAWAEPYAEAHGGFHGNSSIPKVSSGAAPERSAGLYKGVEKIGRPSAIPKKPFPFNCRYCNKVGHKWADCKQRKMYDANVFT